MDEVGRIEFNMDKDSVKEIEILKRLHRIIMLLEEQNDILLSDSEDCCSKCDGVCDKDAEHYPTDSIDDEGIL